MEGLYLEVEDGKIIWYQTGRGQSGGRISNDFTPPATPEITIIS